MKPPHATSARKVQPQEQKTRLRKGCGSGTRKQEPFFRLLFSFIFRSFFFCNRCKAYNSTTVDSSDAAAEKSGTTSSAAAGIADLPYIAVKPCKTTEQTAVRPDRWNLSSASVRSAAQVANRFSAWNWTSRIAGGHQRTVQPRHRPTKDSRSCA